MIARQRNAFGIRVSLHPFADSGGAVRKPKSGWSSPVIASTLIASAALGLAIYSAYLDRQYKELSIKPHLQAEIESEDYHVAVINVGLGPAQIKRIATKFGDNCTVLNEGPDGFDDRLFLETMRNVGDWFLDPLDQLVQRSIWEPTVRQVHSRPLAPTQVLAPGEKIIMFKLGQKQLEAALQKQETLDSDTFNRIVERFLERARTMPYYVEYCSLTGKFCHGAEKIKKVCPQK
jgi:hypothetical protein